MSKLWYRNGDWVHDSRPVMALDDPGLVFGAIVIDRVRTFRHKLYRLSDHITRFRQSCRFCYVPLSVSDQELTSIAERLVEQNSASMDDTDDLVLVMLAAPGVRTSLFMHTMSLDYSRYRPKFERGARLVIPATRQVPSICVDPRAKHRSRMHWWIANQQAKEMDPLADALLLDSEGFVTETATANMFVVKHNKLFTPPANSVLPGISLQVVRELCGELGLKFTEKQLRPEECYIADEIMLACTSWCVAGVSQLDGREIPWPGPMYQRLLARWSEKVGVDIAAQILNDASSKRG